MHLMHFQATHYHISSFFHSLDHFPFFWTSRACINSQKGTDTGGTRFVVNRSWQRMSKWILDGKSATAMNWRCGRSVRAHGGGWRAVVDHAVRWWGKEGGFKYGWRNVVAVFKGDSVPKGVTVIRVDWMKARLINVRVQVWLRVGKCTIEAERRSLKCGFGKRASWTSWFGEDWLVGQLR